MSDASPISFPGPPPEENPTVAGDPRLEAELRRRRGMLRRLQLLLLLGGTVFTLLIWRLVRLDDPGQFLPSGPEPARVVRKHLEALNHGEFREAYLLFSQHYRNEVSFEQYHELVVTHIAVFRTRLLSLTAWENSGNRAVLHTRLLAADGEHYVARFTLVRAGNRWWIDDLRWRNEERRQQGRVSI